MAPCANRQQLKNCLYIQTLRELFLARRLRKRKSPEDRLEGSRIDVDLPRDAPRTSGEQLNVFIFVYRPSVHTSRAEATDEQEVAEVAKFLTYHTIQSTTVVRHSDEKSS